MSFLIVLKQVKKEYPMGHTFVQALRGVNLRLQKGKYYSIIRPSGSWGWAKNKPNAAPATGRSGSGRAPGRRTIHRR